MERLRCIAFLGGDNGGRKKLSSPREEGGGVGLLTFGGTFGL